MEFKLFSKLGSLEGIELYMLIGGLVVLGLLIWAVVSYAKRAKAKDAEVTEVETATQRTQELVYGALSITLAFVLSYFKLFTLPYEGSITLLSMLPIFAYAAYFGPARASPRRLRFRCAGDSGCVHRASHPVYHRLFRGVHAAGTCELLSEESPVGRAGRRFCAHAGVYCFGRGFLQFLCCGLHGATTSGRIR
ncbi:MAG: energy-coupled thiamine transporter ThiT [Eubacteriales bacterium]